MTIEGLSAFTQGMRVISVSFQCWARNLDGEMAIPPSVLLALPPTATSTLLSGLTFAERGFLVLSTVGKATRVQATGLDYGSLGSAVIIEQSTLWK